MKYPDHCYHPCQDCGILIRKGGTRCRACYGRWKKGKPPPGRDTTDPTDEELEAQIAAVLREPLPSWWKEDRAAEGDGERCPQNWEATVDTGAKIVKCCKRHNGKSLV